MKFIVLGGAGAMGRRTVEDLCASSDEAGITEITVADINLDAAEKVIRSIRASPELKVEAKQLDAFQEDQLVEVIRKFDLVISALGPYYLFEERMARAVLEAGVDYISICDEWDVVDKMIHKYHHKAKARGVKFICGMGASPGITNIAALHLSHGLDSVRKIDVSVWLPLDSGAGDAAIQHGVHILSGQTAVWRNSSRVMIGPCSEQVSKRFPLVKDQKVWNMGHSEPVTLPLFIEGVEEVNFYMGFGAGSFLLTGPAKLGWYDRPFLNKAFTQSFIAIEKLISSKNAKPGASRIDVWGRLNNKEEHRTAFGVSTMQESTALALSTGAIMFAKDELLIQEGGVFAPEAIFDTAKCLERLRKTGIRIFSDLEMKHPVN